MKPSSDIDQLLEIMARLRDPEHGCPWDIKQDFSTIKPFTIEEAYEVADAIEREDYDDLCEELGDLLFQAVFYAQMASEQGLFTFNDIIYAINKKMIRRHPHVFGDQSIADPKAVKEQWDNIKLEEKAERAKRRQDRGLPPETKNGLLDQISNAMPANDEALKLQKKLSKVGFDWNNAELVLDKMEEEIGELRAAIKDQKIAAIQDEMGDLMFALVNLARHVDVDPEMALRGTNRKVRKRFAFIEKKLVEQGLTPKEADLAQMEQFWQDAKHQ